jgi:tight adherence protein C
VLLYGALAAIAIAIALLAYAVVPPRQADSGVAGALAAIERHYVQANGPRIAAQPGSDLLGRLPGWLRVLSLRLSPSGVEARLQHQLDVAGNPDRWNPDRLLAVKGLGLVIFAAIGMAIGEPSILIMLALAVAGGGIGFYLPDLLVYNAGLKRQARIQAELPDAMDLLSVCVEAGLGFDAALAQVARNTTGNLASELARALQEMQIGKSRTEALRSTAERTTVPELRAFVSALVQAGELGISVATVLREQAKEMRIKRRQRAEEKAQKIPVKILFPLMLCLMPALFVMILGPGVISIMSLFSTAHL